MKFFVYLHNEALFGADDGRVGVADLDGGGDKFVPNLCVVCHGVRPYTNNPDLGARFLPFDLSSYQYSTRSSRSALEGEFKKLNLGIRDRSNASQATTELIEAWYRDLNGPAGNTDSPAQRDDAVPDRWLPSSDIYLGVIKLGCRSCHVSRDAPLGFGSVAEFQSREVAAHDRVCGEFNMPNARVTYERFWLNYVAGNRAANAPTTILNANQGLLPHWGPGAPCPAP